MVCRNKKFRHIFRNPNASDRVATMGRLSELRIVNWKVDNKGKSTYLLNDKMYNKLL
jgi:hypothetical protein